MRTINYAAGELVLDGSGPRAPERYDPRDRRDALLIAWTGAQRSRNTAQAYRRDTMAWFRWCEGRGVDTLTARRFHVDAYRHDLEGAGLRPSSIARKLTSLSSFYRYAIREGQLQIDNPVADVKRPAVTDESTTSGLTLDEAHAMLDAAGTRGPIDHAIVSVLLHCALRVSELCGATSRDLETESGELMLWVTGKGGRRYRVHVPAPAAEALRVVRGDRRGPLFLDSTGDVLNRHQVTYIIKRAARRAGLIGPDIERRLSPHSMRHTAATLALNAGVPLRDVQDMMRHADPRTTNRYDRARRSVERSPGHVLGRLLAATATEASE